MRNRWEKNKIKALPSITDGVAWYNSSSKVYSLSDTPSPCQLSIYCLSAPNLPFIVRSILLELNSKFFPAGTEVNFVSRGHWRRKVCCSGSSLFFPQAPAVCIVYLQCSVASSMWYYSIGRWLCSRVLLVGHSSCDQLLLEPPGSFIEECN